MPVAITRGSGLAAASALLLALAAQLVTVEAEAAGYDTPILYSARHQAMGGTAISYVSDPSALFHNPAGLSGVHGLALLGDLSLVLGRVRGSPERGVSSVESNLVVAPFFLVGAGLRVHEWLSVGLGFFPVASGGAEYEYELAGNPFVDSTQVLFLEATPALSLNVPKDRWLPGELSIGVGYRVNLVNFERKKGDPDDPRVLAFEMSGASFSGVRIGAQYRPVREFGVGLVFRNRVDVDAEADRVTVFTQTADDASLRFILPAKFGVGVDLDLTRVRFATDVEYALQSQNDRVALEGTLNGQAASVPNVFEWQNGVTARFGVEYRIDVGAIRYPVRAGYAFDSSVTNAAYPSAFGTPPAPTHTLGAGIGFDPGFFQINAAVTRRFGSARISANELRPGCAFCSYEGDYAIGMTGIYLDASVDLSL
jgi:long-subunit fatty acid transport protein